MLTVLPIQGRLESMGSVMRRNLDNKAGVSLPPININVGKLIKGNSNASFYNGMNNMSSLNTSLNAVTSNGTDNHPSLHWYDHLWLSVVGKTWTAYRSENPEVSSAASAAGNSPAPPTPTVNVTREDLGGREEDTLIEPPVFDSDDDDPPSRRQSRLESDVKKIPEVNLGALQTAHQDQLRKDIREKLITVLCELLVK